MASFFTTSLAIYFVLWWIVLFAALPFGVRNQHEAGETGQGNEAAPGTDPGAPVATQMLRKAIWTTIISAVIFTAGMLAYRADLLNVERLSKLMGFPL